MVKPKIVFFFTNRLKGKYILKLCVNFDFVQDFLIHSILDFFITVSGKSI